MLVGGKSKLTLCVHLGCRHIITSQLFALSLCSSPEFVWTGTQVFLASLQPGIRGKTALRRAFASVLPALAEAAQLDWPSCRCGRNDICARCTIANPFVPPLPRLRTGVTNCTCQQGLHSVLSAKTNKSKSKCEILHIQPICLTSASCVAANN